MLQATACGDQRFQVTPFGRGSGGIPRGFSRPRAAVTRGYVCPALRAVGNEALSSGALRAVACRTGFSLP